MTSSGRLHIKQAAGALIRGGRHPSSGIQCDIFASTLKQQENIIAHDKLGFEYGTSGQSQKRCCSHGDWEQQGRPDRTWVHAWGRESPFEEDWLTSAANNMDHVSALLHGSNKVCRCNYIRSGTCRILMLIASGTRKFQECRKIWAWLQINIRSPLSFFLSAMWSLKYLASMCHFPSVEKNKIKRTRMPNDALL